MKKEIPLALLKALEPFNERLRSGHYVIDTSKDEGLFTIWDNDEGSRFSFSLNKAEVRDGALHLLAAYIPASEVDINRLVVTMKVESFGKVLTQWLGLVDEYRSINTIFDDPILKKYEEDFDAKFESADADATVNSFSLEQQLLLDEAITKVIYQLEAKRDEANQESITALIQEAEQIKDSITTSTKRETFSKLSKLFAKIQKGSLKWIKEVYPIIQKEIISQIVKGALHLPSATDLLQ